MSNNSFVTKDGLEMARAQVVQAECARVEPTVYMNPILLKPSADNHSQVVIHGKAAGAMAAREYYGLREKLWAAIQESYDLLSREFEVLVIEGAGSPAEINLKEWDMVNFRVARMAAAPCLLVGDIDRGGVFAWLLGTLSLLEDEERDRVVGLVINKFQGDLKLLEPGLRMLENLSGKKVLGTLPYQLDLWIEEEDAVDLDRRGGPLCPPSQRQPEKIAPEVLDIGVILFPRISHTTDFQILAEEPGVSVRMIKRAEEFGSPDLLILPGTKATLADLEWMRTKGFVKKIQEYVLDGGRILGVCGGFQMLGEVIEDPESIESKTHSHTGLGILPIRTRFFPEKTLRRIRGRIQNMLFSYPVSGEIIGYEIHMGQTEFIGETKSLFEICDEGASEPWRPEGVIDNSGRILGTYLHGLFDEASFRAGFLDALRRSSGKEALFSALPSMALVKEKNYDKLASLLREHLDLNFLESCLKSSLHSS